MPYLTPFCFPREKVQSSSIKASSKVFFSNNNKTTKTYYYYDIIMIGLCESDLQLIIVYYVRRKYTMFR